MSSHFKFSGGKCCCCLDAYYFNDDTVIERLRTRSGTTVPTLVDKIVGSSAGYLAYWSIDYRNKLIMGMRPNFSSLNARALWINRDLSLSSFSKVVDMQGGTTPVNALAALACDWERHRMFYITVKTQTPRDILQIRAVNYDGTNDVFVTEESGVSYNNPPHSGTSPVGIVEWSLNYHVQLDRLYYLRSWREVIAGSGLRHYELRSVMSDGSDQRTELSLDAGLPTLTDNTFLQIFSHLAFVRNALVFTTLETLLVGATQQDNYIKRIDLTTGVVTTLLHNIHFVPTANNGAARYITPRYSIKDDRIYYLARAVSPISAAHTGMRSIKWDGSELKVHFNLAPTPGTGNTFHFQPSSTGKLGIGCGFETTGPDYNGPG